MSDNMLQRTRGSLYLGKRVLFISDVDVIEEVKKKVVVL